MSNNYYQKVIRINTLLISYYTINNEHIVNVYIVYAVTTALSIKICISSMHMMSILTLIKKPPKF